MSILENWDENYHDDEDADWCDDDIDDDYDEDYDSVEGYNDFNIVSQSVYSSKKSSGINEASSHRKSKENKNGKAKIKSNENSKVNIPDIIRSNLKVELRHISISSETKNLIMDTLRSIYGDNFSLDNTVIVQSKRKLSDQYWVNRGHLTVRNFYNYSSVKNTDKEKVNSILLENLERYGFHTDHCFEALLHTNNNVEESIRILLNAYFNIDFQSNPDEDSKNLDEMDDELVALKSIFENIIEEKIKHKHWIFHLQLEYLAEWYFKNSVKKENQNMNQKRLPYKPTCRNFNLVGTCKYGSKCRFLHIKNSQVEKKESEGVDWQLKSSFDLEIRFFDGCKYPDDVPLILFVAQHREFSSNTSLRITRYLLIKAKNFASQGYAYCYNLIDLLQNSENILNWLNDEFISKLTISPRPLIITEGNKLDVAAQDELISNKSDSRPFKSNRSKNASKDTPSRDHEIISAMKSKVNNFKYKQMQTQRKQLPAWNVQREILNELNRAQVVVIVGDTGCGKTTQIPQFILDEWLFPAAGLSSRKRSCERVEIICTQPRRLSAIGVTTRVAQERIEKPGETIGYQIRLESCSSSLTKLLFCTTGILLKKLESDPLLKSVTHVIVDEVHERSEESDFLLLILKEILKVRTDLKILLMSATLNARLFSSYFNNAPLIEIPGRMFPVTELYLEEILEVIDYTMDEYSKTCRKIGKSMSRQLDDIECDLTLADTVSAATVSKPTTPDESLSPQQLFYRYKDFSMKTRKSLLLMDPEKVDVELIISVLTWIVDGDHNYPREGAILVFLPGLADIMAVNDELTGHSILSPRSGKFIIIPLHSTISNEEQSSVFKKSPRGVRRIVLSTNIAETSITIDDCVFVVDSGKMKETKFDSSKNMSCLETMWISKANAKQRRGRAGRVMPGLCIRLYTKQRHDYIFTAQPVPEIQRVALDQIILRTKSLKNFIDSNISDVLGALIQPPELNNIGTAVQRLKDVGALDDDQELTPLGRHLAVLPVDVKIGKLILFGAVFCCLDSVLTIAASLSNKSPFVSPFTKREESELRKKHFASCNSDHLTVLNAYKQWHSIASTKWIDGKRFADENFLSWRTLEMISDLKHQYLDLLVSIGFASVNSEVRRRHHEDCVFQITSKELNENGNNNRLLSGILCAALYPNLVKVFTPDKMYVSGISGAIPKDFTAGELKFKTKNDGFVFLHPSSVNFGASDFKNPYLVYQEKLKTSKIFIHDSTMVSAASLMLFAGSELKIELNSGMYTVSIENGWLVFALRSSEDARMLQHMRLEFSKLLENKIKNPFLNLADYPAGKRIISTIVYIIMHTI